MSPVLLLSAVLVAPPMETAATVPMDTKAAVVDRSKKSSPRKLEDVQKAYLKAMQSSARRAKPKPPKVVPALVEVYGDLEGVEGLSHAERSRMRGVVKARLEELRDKLIRELLRNKKLADRRKRRGPREPNAKPVDEKAEMLAGGGASAQAIQLIDLIQNTIEPDSWQVNGGKGSIYYFDQLKVLVIRQTGEVHHQIGGVLGQLRK